MLVVHEDFFSRFKSSELEIQLCFVINVSLYQTNAAFEKNSAHCVIWRGRNCAKRQELFCYGCLMSRNEETNVSCHSKQLLYTQPSIPKGQENWSPEAAIFASETKNTTSEIISPNCAQNLAWKKLRQKARIILLWVSNEPE